MTPLTDPHVQTSPASSDFDPRRTNNPTMSTPVITKTITSGMTIPEKSGWLSPSGVVLLLGIEVAMFLVDVGVAAVGERVMVGVALGGAGVEVAVAGGVTRSSNCCPGRMMEAELRPFQLINSIRLTSYRSAIQARYSPLATS